MWCIAMFIAGIIILPLGRAIRTALWLKSDIGEISKTSEHRRKNRSG